MRKMLSLVILSSAAMIFAPGCASEADEEGIDHGADATEQLPEAPGVQPETNGNGDWCFAQCSDGVIYAGPNVTKNCDSWALTVCGNRGRQLRDAYWCSPACPANYYLQ